MRAPHATSSITRNGLGRGAFQTCAHNHENFESLSPVRLPGLVLPIGGLKEKTIAARRSDVDTLIFPAANRRDFEELPEYLKEGLSVHFARTFDDVFAVAFPGIVAGGGEVEQ